MVFGFLLVVCLKWSPHTERYLRALALPVWAVLLFYVGECLWRGLLGHTLSRVSSWDRVCPYWHVFSHECNTAGSAG